MILYIFPEAGLVLFMSLYQWVGIAYCRNHHNWCIQYILFTSQRSTWSRFVQLLQPCRWLYVKHSQFKYFLQSNRTYGVVELSLWLVRVLSNVRSLCLYLEMMKWQHFLLKQLHQFFLFVLFCFLYAPISSWRVLCAFTVCGQCGGRRRVFSDLYISLALWVGWSWSWWGTLFTDDQGGGDDDALRWRCWVTGRQIRHSLPVVDQSRGSYLDLSQWELRRKPQPIGMRESRYIIWFHGKS